MTSFSRSDSNSASKILIIIFISGDSHYLRPAEALSRRAFFSVPRERHISERHVSVMDTIPDKSGSDDCISITSEKSMIAHPWRYTQEHEGEFKLFQF